MSQDKFLKAVYQPLSREEVIAHIEGRGTSRPPFAATCMLYKPEGFSRKTAVREKRTDPVSRSRLSGCAFGKQQTIYSKKHRQSMNIYSIIYEYLCLHFFLLCDIV